MPATLPVRADAAGPARFVLASRSLDLIFLVILASWVVGSRIPYLNDYGYLGKDGPLYIHSLALDENYRVPMPGNIGYVLLGKLASLFTADPVTAFLSVNVGLTLLGVVFCYLFATLVVPRSLAAALTFAMSCNTIVWFHGGIIASYPVWLATLPAIGWFGVRYKREGRFGNLLVRASRLASAWSFVLTCSFLGDHFGSAAWLWAGHRGDTGSSAERSSPAPACWFFGTAWVLGGVSTYLARVREKHEFDRTGFSLFSRGLVEGLMRNGVKFFLFLAWGASIALVPFFWGVGRELLAWRSRCAGHSVSCSGSPRPGTFP